MLKLISLITFPAILMGIVFTVLYACVAIMALETIVFEKGMTKRGRIVVLAISFVLAMLTSFNIFN